MNMQISPQDDQEIHKIDIKNCKIDEASTSEEAGTSRMVEMSTAKSPQYENAQASEVEAQNPQTADVQAGTQERRPLSDKDEELHHRVQSTDERVSASSLICGYVVTCTQGVWITRESMMTGLFEAKMCSEERGICFGSPGFLLADLQWHLRVATEYLCPVSWYAYAAGSCSSSPCPTSAQVRVKQTRQLRYEMLSLVIPTPCLHEI
ncbi:hypothetical protein GEV33_006606 [Tenebrio molitor]|uniref:Uncharacterized protein n=1 Tax=Tenebrio molitor TaxID=7067 RepID=A0A8J6LD28_TENMO|nr:hypothetical protein GEV33_006606 [Tenebrio molitor]